MPFLYRSTKKGRKKGNSDVPSEASLRACANDVALSLHSCLRGNMQIQFLRSHFDRKMRARKGHASSEAKVFAMCYAPCVSKNFMLYVGPYGIVKNLANSKPILGVRYMRPRWRTLAKAKAPPFIVERREAGRSWRERPSFFSFALSLWKDKERASKAIRSARGLPRSMSVWLRTKQIFCSLRRHTLTLCLRHARAGNLCLFFALPQRIGEEKASRGKPLETPSARENCRRSAPPMFSRNQANSDFALAI